MDKILILGDSSSMTVGLERKTYPFILADRHPWKKDTEIVNCSQAGFTSADACAFFFRHIKSLLPSLKAVIIYLGNNEGYAAELRKGRYTAARHYKNMAREALGIGKPKNMLKNKLLFHEWNPDYNPDIEKPEDPADFEFNLGRIIKYCAKKGVPVILVRPVANLSFPSGLGKGNFIFYKYLNINEKISGKITIFDRRFTDALKLHEEGEHRKAIDLYKRIIEETRNQAHSEYGSLVENNYACALAGAGRWQEAEVRLKSLLTRRGARKEIVSYNLAQLYKRLGYSESYHEYLKISYEADTSLYRIKESYAAAIDRVSEAFRGNVSVIDMRRSIKDSSFVDYCHMLPEAHELLSQKIMDELAKRNITGGSERAVIKNMLYNAWLSLGDTTEFYTYCMAYAPYGEEDIRKDVDAVARGSADISKEMEQALRYYMQHPCFPTIEDVLRFAPKYSFDIGRFPEFYVIRHLIPYMRVVEKTPLLRERFSREQGLLHGSDSLMSILPEPAAAKVPAADPYIERSFERGRLERIINKIEEAIAAHIMSGNQVYERLKDTMFWYFRHCLRWGSHSRISMRYDRLLLENLTEALAVASVLDRDLGRSREKDIVRLIGTVEEIDRIHNKFASAFSLEEDCRGLLKDYDLALEEVASGNMERKGIRV